MRIIVTFLLLFLSLNIIAGQKKTYNVHIWGEITNFPVLVNDSILFEQKDILSGESEYSYSKIEQNGSFKIDLFTEKAIDITFTMLNKATRIFINPNDSLQIQFDYNDYKAELNNNIFIFKGNHAEISKDLCDFNVYLSSHRKNEDYFKDIKILTPDEYKANRIKLKEQDLQILNDFNKIQSRSEKFQLWAIEYLRYLCGVHLFAYPSLFAHLNQKNISVSVPYYDFTRELTLQPEKDIHNTAYINYIQYYNSFLQDKLKGDIFMRFNPSFNEKITLISEKGVGLGSSDKERLLSLKNKRFLELETKDSAFCTAVFIKYKELIDEKKADLFAQNTIKFYSSRLNGEILDLFLAIVLFKEIDAVNYLNVKALAKEYFKIAKTTYLNEKVLAEYSNFEQRMNIIKFPAGVNINSFKVKSGDDFLKKLTQKYSGKVIYVDFWATWCGPCRIEFGYAKNIKEKFKDKNVVFVYLCGTSQEKVWKAVISELDLKGEHYFLDDKIQTELYTKLSISSIPHYILINKKGKIIRNNAYRPSQTAELIKEIEKIL